MKRLLLWQLPAIKRPRPQTAVTAGYTSPASVEVSLNQSQQPSSSSDSNSESNSPTPDITQQVSYLCKLKTIYTYITY